MLAFAKLGPPAAVAAEVRHVPDTARHAARVVAEPYPKHEPKAPERRVPAYVDLDPPNKQAALMARDR